MVRSILWVFIFNENWLILSGWDKKLGNFWKGGFFNFEKTQKEIFSWKISWLTEGWVRQLLKIHFLALKMRQIVSKKHQKSTLKHFSRAIPKKTFIQKKIRHTDIPTRVVFDSIFINVSYQFEIKEFSTLFWIYDWYFFGLCVPF